MTTFSVKNTNDRGNGSLRRAIRNANEREGHDIIRFDNDLRGETITLISGELQITDDLTIEGLGANQLTVSGNENSRVFNIDDGTDELIGVAITGLTIADGSTTDNGGGILNREELRVTQSTISDNTAFGGGGIRNYGTLTLNNSAVSNNFATFEGGISNLETLFINNSTVSNNTADFQNGGIRNLGIATLINSTVNNNVVNNGSGGGISNDGRITGQEPPAELNLINSSVSGNRAAFDGGGILNFDRLNVTGTIISNNTARDGSGIANDLGGDVNLTNSIINGNTANRFGGGIFNTSDVAVTESIILGNIAAENGGGVFNTAAATFTSNSSLIVSNIPNNVFTEGMSMLEGLQATDLVAFA